MPITSPSPLLALLLLLSIRPVVKPATNLPNFFFSSPISQETLPYRTTDKGDKPYYTTPRIFKLTYPQVKEHPSRSTSAQPNLYSIYFTYFLDRNFATFVRGALCLSPSNFLYKYTRIPCIHQINYCTKERSLLYYIKNFQIKPSSRRVNYKQCDAISPIGTFELKTTWKTSKETQGNFPNLPREKFLPLTKKIKRRFSTFNTLITR